MGLRVNLLPSSTDMMSIRQDNGSEKAPATPNKQSQACYWEHLQIRWGKAKFSSKLPIK